MSLLPTPESLAPDSPSRIRALVYVAICLALSAGWLLAINLPTLGEDFIHEFFRIGVIPWSDAHNWYEGADRITQGRELTSVAARRPLYPLFLANLTWLAGGDYLQAIGAQLLLTAIAFAGAAAILRPVADRFSATLLLSLLLLWRPENVPLFMTETLAMPLLALAFAAIWRGLDQRDDGSLMAGYLLFGLSQAVRPWALLCLVTVPILGAFGKGIAFRRRCLRTLGLLGCLALGYVFHPIAGSLFSSPGQTTTNSGEILFAQVSGGISWTATWDDPEIRRLVAAGKSPEELNRAVWRRCWEIFKEDPSKFGKATVATWKSYFRQTLWPFPRGSNSILWLSCAFMGLALLDPARHRKPSAILKPGFAGILLWLLLTFFFTQTLSVALALGLLLCLYRRRPFDIFVLLYLLGILLSLPFLGNAGGQRPRIGGDILLYTIASLGIGWILDRSTSPRHRGGPITRGLRMTAGVPATVFAVLAGVLIVAPLTIRSLARDAPTIPLSQRQISEIEARHPGILRAGELDRISGVYGLDPEIAEISGRRAYRSQRFERRDSLEFEAGKGLDLASRKGQLWPLGKRNFHRTILISGRNFLILPNITRDQLAEIGDRELLIAGRVKTRSREQRFDIATAILADEVWYAQDDGALSRLSLTQPSAP